MGLASCLLSYKSLYLFDVDGFRLFLFDHNNENEKVKYGDNCLRKVILNEK